MKKAAGIVGLILAAVFLILAFNTNAPEKYISSYGSNKMTEYVGGDAYNYIIEASLRGGEIAGAQISKAIYFACAAILGVLSLTFLATDPSFPQPIDNKKDFECLTEQAKETAESLKRIEGQLDNMNQPAEKAEE